MKIAIPEPWFSKGVKPLIFTLALLPLAALGWGFWIDELGANPIEKITRDTGEWTLRFLLLTLVISTLRRRAGWTQSIKLRRMLGLFAFFYGVLHLFTYLWLDKFFWWEDIIEDIIERPFITVGMLAFVLMIPLALTSTNAMMRRLKKNWIKLHKLVYAIAIFGIVHFWWLIKADFREPLIYTMLLTLLFAERLWRPSRHSRTGKQTVS